MGLHTCEIRYAVVDPHLIFNYIGPSAGFHRKPNCKELTEKRISERNKRDNFYNKLEANILEHGIRNPIIVNGGWISGAVFKNMPDKEKEKGMENLLFCYQLGGSRLYIAQKNNLQVPCIIKDFVGRFEDALLLDSEEKVRQVYIDQPVKVQCDGKSVAIAWDQVKI